MIYIYKAEPARPLVRMASYVGCRNPMYCTGVGKSILAYLPDEEVIKVWDSSEIHTYTEKDHHRSGHTPLQSRAGP